MKPEAIAQSRLEVWAILEDFLQARLIEATIPAEMPAPDRQAVTRPGPKSGRIARVPIFGTITRRDSFWSILFGGGASVEALTKTLRELGADPDVSTVLLDVDSPGGTVSGIPELAGTVRALSARKHVVAMVNSLSASAAYWVASQADEIVATPEAMVGSIGVFTTHYDLSKMYETDGVKVTYVYAGKYKVEGNPMEPLSDESRAHMQVLVDESYNLFVGDVATGRGVSATTVRSDYGQGRVLTAKDAKAVGMIDRIATFDETVSRLAGGRVTDRSNSQARHALMRRRLDLLTKS